MPTMKNYLLFIYVTLGYVILITSMVYFRSALDIEENWALYRCNPPYWVFSKNIAEDFSYCVQNTQISTMGFLLEPANYMISMLSSMGGDFATSINQIRTMFSFIRDFVTNIVENVFGVFLNLIIEFQKMIISIKDLVGKMLGIVVSILYILDGSIKTMESAWAGPPGQMVQAIGSCFHPNTIMQISNNNEICSKKIKDIVVGDIILSALSLQCVVTGVLKLPMCESYYQVGDVFVTGSHFIYDVDADKFVKVCNYAYAKIKPDIHTDYVYCLQTSNNRIYIDNLVFWDWDDDVLL